MRYERRLFGWEQRNLNQRGERTFSVEEGKRPTRSGQIRSERTRTRRKEPCRLVISAVTPGSFLVTPRRRSSAHRIPRDTLIGVNRKQT